jgi:hypothetical protein
MALKARDLYASSNGDRWYLVRDAVNQEGREPRGMRQARTKRGLRGETLVHPNRRIPASRRTWPRAYRSDAPDRDAGG